MAPCQPAGPCHPAILAGVRLQTATIGSRRAATFLLSYVGLAWVAIQVADLIAPRLGLPDWIPTAVIAISALALPLALLVYAFVFPQISPAYIDKQIEQVQAAKVSVLMMVHTLDPGARDSRIAALQKALGEAVARGVDVRLLAPNGPDRAQAGYELAEIHGVPVRFLSELEDQDLRFTLVDQRVVVISHQPPGTKSLSQVFSTIHSDRLHAILSLYFSNLWNAREAADFHTYVRDLCLQLGGQVPSSHQKLAERLGIPINVVAKARS